MPGPGTVLGDYRLVAVIAEGGMGCVYLAEHVRIGRRVALKLLRPEFAANPGTVKRFFDEARAVNQINHENIVDITDFVENQGEAKYYIMELLRGATLAQTMRRDGIMPLARTLRIAMQMCRALAAVHAAGIIHRDLKPDNVFITERGGQTDWVKLLDFGVAKFAALSGELRLDRTAAGALIGTPDYMSPEQASGQSVDCRTDIYAVGAILYEMVTGRKPLSANSLGEMVMKQLTTRPLRPSKLAGLPHKIPHNLEALILECLAKSSTQRPQNMQEIEKRLETVLNALSNPPAAVDGAPATPAGSGGRLIWRSRVGWFTLLAAAAVVPVGVAIVATLVRPKAPPRAVDLHSPSVATTPPEAHSPAREVVIHFESKPSGASIHQEGIAEPLGVTPAAISFSQSDKPLGFTLRHDGYEQVSQAIALDRDGQVDVVLVKTGLRSPVHGSGGEQKSSAERRTKSKSNATLDPFSN